MKTVFFIIPVYRVEPYLRRCVDSVLAQSYAKVQIVLVDDGSPDACPQICDAYAQAHENIAVIHKENGGLSDARNAGLLYLREHAKPDDYLTFLDSDDFVHPEFAARMLALCEENGCAMAQCAYEKGSADSFSPQDCDANVQLLSAQDALLGYSLKSLACAKLYRADTFRDLFFPVGVINEDEFVTYRAVYSAGRIALSDEKLLYYFQHGGSIMDNVARKVKDNPRRYDYIRAYDERAEFFRQKNMPEQVQKTKEKLCTDLILRYCEQMYLPREERDPDCTGGKYLRMYRESFQLMIRRRGMPPKRRLMYIAFYIMPASAVLMGKIFQLRK